MLSWLAVSAIVPATLSAATPSGPARNLEVVELRVPGQSPMRLYARSHALVIGASAYRGGWSSLPGVPGDVQAVARLLAEQGFEVETLMNPTRDRLDQALRSFVRDHGQQEDNRLVVYFAGHGHTLTTAAGVRLGYLVPVDAPRPDRDLSGFKSMAYSMESIEGLARQMDAKHALFLFDSCFSGTIFRTRASVPESITDKTGKPVRQFITAGDENQTVPDQSIFRRQLEAALGGEADMNGDRYITGSELGFFLEDTVTNYSHRSQTPRWGKIRDPDLDKGDFVFALAPRQAPPPEPQAMEIAFWNSVDAQKPGELREYLRRFPDGVFAGLARQRLAEWSPASPGPAPSGNTGRRTSSEQVVDETIELLAVTRIADILKGRGAVRVKSHGAVVLVVGAVPDQKLVDSIDVTLRDIYPVRMVINELKVAPANQDAQADANDLLLAAKVRAAVARVDSAVEKAAQVTVFRSAVFLTGRVSEQEAQVVSDTARAVAGVQRVVRAFELVDARTLQALKEVSGI